MIGDSCGPLDVGTALEEVSDWVSHEVVGTLDRELERIFTPRPTSEPHLSVGEDSRLSNPRGRPLLEVAHAS